MPRRTQTCSTPRACSSSAAARMASTVSSTGWPTSAASSSTFGVTVCTRTDPSSTGAAAVALATLTGSNTERTPASWAAESSQRMTVASRLASTTRASAPPSRVGTTARSATRELVGGAHVGDRDVQVAALVEHGGVGAGGVRRDDDVPALDARGAGALHDGVAGRVVAHRGDEHGRPAEPGEVLGDVAAHSPDRRRRGAGVARAEHRGPRRCAPWCRARRRRRRAPSRPRAADVAAAQDDALAGEVGQVHRDRGPGRADPLGDRRGVEQRLGAQQVDDLALAGGQVHVADVKRPCTYKASAPAAPSRSTTR